MTARIERIMACRPNMPELSEKSRLGQKVVVRRMRRRRNKLSRGLRWRNRKRSRRASYRRVLYNYYRTYDPSTGRYLESDPIGLAAGLNTYAYVGNMPTTYVDPFGLDRLPPSYPVQHPDYYYGPKGDFYETTGRPRPPTGPGLSMYGEIGGCLLFGCAETRFFPDPGRTVEPLIAPELVGGGFSFCMEAKPDPGSCESDDASSRDSLLDLIDETSIGMGKRFGFTVGDINPRENRKLCFNIGLGFGSPISPAHSLSEQAVFDPNQPLPEIP